MTVNEYEKLRKTFHGRIAYVLIRARTYQNKFLKEGTVLEPLFGDQPFIVCRAIDASLGTDLVYIRLNDIVHIIFEEENQ